MHKAAVKFLEHLDLLAKLPVDPQLPVSRETDKNSRQGKLKDFERFVDQYPTLFRIQESQKVVAESLELPAVKAMIHQLEDWEIEVAELRIALATTICIQDGSLLENEKRNKAIRAFRRIRKLIQSSFDEPEWTTYREKNQTKRPLLTTCYLEARFGIPKDSMGRYAKNSGLNIEDFRRKHGNKYVYKWHFIEDVAKAKGIDL